MLDSKGALLEGARYSKVEALFFEDRRFEALPDATRQAAFSEWQDSRRRKAEEDERNALTAKVRHLEAARNSVPCLACCSIKTVMPQMRCEDAVCGGSQWLWCCRWIGSRSCWRSGRRARTRC